MNRLDLYRELRRRGLSPVSSLAAARLLEDAAPHAQQAGIVLACVSAEIPRFMQTFSDACTRAARSLAAFLDHIPPT